MNFTHGVIVGPRSQRIRYLILFGTKMDSFVRSHLFFFSSAFRLFRVAFLFVCASVCVCVCVFFPPFFRLGEKYHWPAGTVNSLPRTFPLRGFELFDAARRFRRTGKRRLIVRFYRFRGFLSPRLGDFAR